MEGKEIYNIFDLEDDEKEVCNFFDVEDDGEEVHNFFFDLEDDGKEIYNLFQPNRPTRRKPTTNSRRKNLLWETVRKYNAGTNRATSSSTSLNTKRLDEDTQNLAYDHVPHELKKQAIMQAKMEKIFTQAQLAQMMMSVNFCSPSPSQREPRPVSWERPPEGFPKLNVDGSLYESDHRAGFGCLLRDDCGAWVVGISGLLGSNPILYAEWQTSVLYAELVALGRGLLLAWDFGIRKLVCHSDSLPAVTLVSKDLDYRHQFAGLAAEIQILLRRDWEVRVEHTLREGNSCADRLAKEGARDDVALKVWVAAPPSMTRLLLGDALGVPSIRL